MVEYQLRARGIDDERVLDAMARVPRELFVPEEFRPHAYDDAALPIGADQTIIVGAAALDVSICAGTTTDNPKVSAVKATAANANAARGVEGS